MLESQIPVNINIDRDKSFTYQPNPSFGSVLAPLTLSFDLDKHSEQPKEITIESIKDLHLSPFCTSLHYGQTIFEGMKAFNLENNKVGVFRLNEHAKRFSNSAKKMAMCPFSDELFSYSIKLFLKYAKKFVPKKERHSLYLRPLLFANDPIIKVNTATNYRFIIMASIVGDYFTSGITGSKVLVNKNFVRSFPGGTGEAKTAANYAMSLQALEYAKSKGFEQVLYLDAINHTIFEELGGMNFFVVKNNELITPRLTGQILRGITRESIITIAQKLGIACHEIDYSLDEFLSHNEQGDIDEVFATGTAAVISPITQIGIQNNIEGDIKKYHFKIGSLSEKLRNALTDIQYGKSSINSDWLTIIE